MNGYFLAYRKNSYLNKKVIFIIVLALFTAAINFAYADNINLNDDEISEMLIRKSISAYPGQCACPYQKDRVGKICGGRSAWSKSGGYKPLCYKNEINNSMIKKVTGILSP